MIIRTQKFKKGFGLIEVLIAGVIIITILGALVSVGNMALLTSNRLKTQSQATDLAQAGLELVRQNRDTNWVDSKDVSGWDSIGESEAAILPLMTATGVSEINGFLGFSLGGENNYTFRSGENQSELITLDGTDFQRQIQLSKVTGILPDDLSRGSEGEIANSQNALKVKSIVRFDNGTKSVDVSEILTNWRPNF